MSSQLRVYPFSNPANKQNKSSNSSLSSTSNIEAAHTASIWNYSSSVALSLAATLKRQNFSISPFTLAQLIVAAVQSHSLYTSLSLHAEAVIPGYINLLYPAASCTSAQSGIIKGSSSSMQIDKTNTGSNSQSNFIRYVLLLS